MTTPTAKSSFRRQFRRKPNASIPAARHTRPKPMKTPCGMTDQQAIQSQGIKPPLLEPTVRRQPESNRISLCRRQLPRRVGTPAPTPLTNPIAIDTTHPRKHCLALRHPVQGRVTGPILRAPLTNATTIDPTIPPSPCPALRPTQPGHAAGKQTPTRPTNPTANDATNPPTLALNANQMQRATRIGSRPPSTVPIQIATAHGSPQLHPQRRRPARRVLGRRQPPTVQATAPVHLPPNTLTSIQKTPIRREPQSHQLTLPGDLT